MQNDERGFKEGAEVTVWYRFDKKEGWVHNHIEPGWKFDTAKTPTPVAETVEGRMAQEKAWKSGKWRKAWAYIEKGKVVEIAKTKGE
jgi:hypothetical protein